MKKFVCLMLAICMLTGLVCVYASEQLSIDVDNERIKIGETVNVDVNVNEPLSVRGIQFVLNYEFGSYTVSDIVSGEIADYAIVSEINDKDAGKVKVAFVFDDVYDIEGNVCSVSFKSRDDIGIGKTVFSLKNVEIIDGDNEFIEHSDVKTNVEIYTDEIIEKTPMPTQPVRTTEPTPEPGNDNGNLPEASEKPETTKKPESTKKPSGGGSSSSGSGSSSSGSVVIGGNKVNVPVVESEKRVCRFSDIQNHWAKEDITYLYENNIINGMSETSFAPDKNVSRAEFVKMIIGMLDIPEKNDGAEIKFDDVPESAWYFEAVTKATALGIVNGYDENFMPDKNITREEMVVISDRFISCAGLDYNEENISTEFEDESEISDWSKDAVSRAVKGGLFVGMDGCFNPKGIATRAQAATVIKRIYNMKNK